MRRGPFRTDGDVAGHSDFGAFGDAALPGLDKVRSKEANDILGNHELNKDVFIRFRKFQDLFTKVGKQVCKYP